MPRPQHSDRYKLVCNILVEARMKSALTQADLAKRLAKPQSYVSKYENGERRLDIVELLDVIAALGLQPGTLVARMAKVVT